MTDYDFIESFEEVIFTAAEVQELLSEQLVTFLDSDLTKIQLGILRILRSHQPMSVKELSNFMYMNYGNTSTQCKKLEAMAYLERRRNSEDERYVYLYLTEDGQATVLKSDEWLLSLGQELKNHLDYQEELKLLESLDTLQEFFHKTSGLLKQEVQIEKKTSK